MDENYYDAIKVTDEEKERWTRLQLKSMERKVMIYRILMIVVILLSIFVYWLRGKQNEIQIWDAYNDGINVGKQSVIEKYGIEVDDEN